MGLRWLCLIATAVFLSGCALPAAVTVASFALDTGSYVMSGKTLTDHGLSMAMDEDCSMVRVLDENDEICRENRDYAVANDELTPLPDNGGLDVSLASGDGPRSGVGYAQLAQRVNRARGVGYAQLAQRVNRARGVGYAQLAQRVNRARTVDTTYLAAGMIDSDI